MGSQLIEASEKQRQVFLGNCNPDDHLCGQYSRMGDGQQAFRHGTYLGNLVILSVRCVLLMEPGRYFGNFLHLFPARQAELMLRRVPEMEAENQQLRSDLSETLGLGAC